LPTAKQPGLAKGAVEPKRADEPPEIENPERLVTYETKFGILKAMFTAAAVRDTSGEYSDVLLAEFFEACDLYRDIFSKVGGAVAGFIVKDVDHNLTMSRGAYMECPEKRKTMKSFLQPHHPDNHLGIEKILWLLRGFEYFLVFCQLLFEGDGSNAAVKAYSRTLMQYHPRALQVTVKVVIRAMPSRMAVCQSAGSVWWSACLQSIASSCACVMLPRQPGRVWSRCTS